MSLNRTLIMLNECDEYDCVFELEEWVRKLSLLDQVYILALFDCCRELYKKNQP